MAGPQERRVPTSYINGIFRSEQSLGDDIPVVDGNSPEAGGTATGSMTKQDVLTVLKQERAPKTTPPTELLVEIEGEIFSANEYIVPKKDRDPVVVHDTRRGRKVVTISTERGVLGKRDVRKLPLQANTQDVNHISVHEALKQFSQDEISGGLPTEKTLQKNARLTHEPKPWKHKNRSSQGGWFSNKERRRIQKTGIPR